MGMVVSVEWLSDLRTLTSRVQNLCSSLLELSSSVDIVSSLSKYSYSFVEVSIVV